MRPDARYGSAIGLLDRILAGEPAEKVLTNWARSNRYAGSGDRAAVRDIVFTGLRNRNSFSARAGGTGGRAVVLGMVAEAGLDPDSVFTGQTYAPPFLSAIERAALLPETPAGVCDVPDWLIPRLGSDLGAEFPRVMQALRHRAPVDLRVNLIKSTVRQAADLLARDGIDCEPLALSPNGLRVVAGERRLARSAAYLGGAVEFQDAGAQCISRQLAALKPRSVLDYCAGGGGKTLALASELDRGVTFTAYDKAPERLHNIKERADRAGVEVNLAPTDPACSAQQYDLVLLDVPCSGSGAWRRNPDAKWKFREQDLQDLQSVQSEILRRTAGLVSPDGRLCYVTCSLLTAENADPIGEFLTERPDWSMAQEIRLLPGPDSDGFYMAVLGRKNNF